MKRASFILSFLTSLSICLGSCRPNHNQRSTEVRYTGALRSAMSGDMAATASLDTLKIDDTFYALGAIENLRGEIQIFKGKALNTNVADSIVHLDTTFSKKAALLVYSYVEDWNETAIPKGLQSNKDLESFIRQEAIKSKMDLDRPFPFLIEGTVAALDWHIIDWPQKDTIHTHEKHKLAGINGSIENQEVMVLGFYSNEHHGLFTHHTTNLHMHFKLNDQSLAGHVDHLQPTGTAILKLPKP